MTPKLILLLAFAASAFAQNRLINNVGNFIHDVANLDRSLVFYKDVVGMDSPRPAGNWQEGGPVAKMYDAGDVQFRVGNAQISGSPMRVELAEFQTTGHTPIRHEWGSAGSSVLMLTVNDLAPVQARLKAANAPVLVDLKKACDGQGLVVADPDGFAVMLIERSGQAASPDPAKDPAKSNFTNLRFGYFVSSDAVAKGPFAALGLPAETRTHICQSIEEALFGASASIITLPTGFEIWLAKGAPSKTSRTIRPSDPGAGVLRLAASDFDAAAQALNQAGVKIVSEGGVAQTLPGGLHAAIFGAPDGLFIQIVK